MAWGAYRSKAVSAAGSNYFATWSVRKKLLVSLIPPVLLILVVAGYVTNWFSSRYLNQSLQRTAQVQNLAQAHEVEQLLEYFRRAAISLAQHKPDREHLRQALEQWRVHHGTAIKELSFVDSNSSDTVLLVCVGEDVVEVDHAQYTYIKGSPISYALKLRGLKSGHVKLSELTGVVYPPSAFPQHTGPQSLDVFRVVTPVQDGQGALQGYIVLGVDAHALRNVLSLYNSSRSPLYAFARTSENRFSYFFDDQGWILFQSENFEDPDRALSAETARLGMTGDYGMPNYDNAFRPLPNHESFWRMVVTVQAGRAGVEEIELPTDSVGMLSANHFAVFAPVRFMSDPGKGQEVIGGITFIDRSRLTDAAEFKHLDVMMVITFSGMGLVAFVIFCISQVITRPLHLLTAEIGAIFSNKTLRPIQLASHDMESDLLKRAINKMILSLQEKQEQIRWRDEQIYKVQQREKISFDSEIPASLGWRLVGEIPDLIGKSQPMATLQSLIRKAASTEADVLVVGETGTGKELTAEAVHKFSSRSSKPFISINCGGLDENLLMDTLFGHVKGAFTEARTDRKGAFLASDGGTLFLDEIGTATERVQKALLRALSVRQIRPLGSDKEVEFNVRVISATNVDLLELVQRGEFRDDLYYRLKVIYIQTPSLRQRREDIPILANHFLKVFAAAAGKPEVGMTRGALEKLTNHNWPGNVRELKNCITRALAFADGDVLYAEDLMFDDDVEGESSAMDEARVVGGLSAGRGVAIQEQQYRPSETPPPMEYSDGPRPDNPGTPLESTGNQRVQIALQLAREKGKFSRVDYQNAVGAGISQRTAQYDLQSFVKKDLLRKHGKGPATLYLLP